MHSRTVSVRSEDAEDAGIAAGAGQRPEHRGSLNAVAQSASSRHRSRVVLSVVAVLVLAGVLFAIPAGKRPFWSSDEARFALLAQDMLDHGRWLIPQLRGEPYLNKPQLYFWSIALVSLPGSRVTEMTAAIPSVLSAIATVAAVVAIGQLAWGWSAGIIAGLVLATTPVFFVFSHQVLSDVMLTAWMTWALYFMLRAATTGWSRGAVLGLYLCVGAAVLSKGPAGFAALAAILVAVLATDGVTGLRGLRLGTGIMVLVILMLPWVVPYVVGSDGRFTNTVVMEDYGTWYFANGIAPRLRAFMHAFTDFVPWSILLLTSLAWWRGNADAGRRRLGLATLTLAILLALSGTHRARYLIPVYPGLALLVAHFITRAADVGGRRLLRAGFAVFGAVALAAMVVVAMRAAAFTGEDRAFTPAGAEIAVIAALAAVIGAAAMWSAWRQTYSRGAVAIALGVAGILLVQGWTYPARYTHQNDVRPLAAAVARHAGRDAIVIGYPDLRLSYDYYLRRRVVEVPTADAVAAAVARSPESVVITTQARWTTLAPALPPTWRVLATAVVADREMVVAGKRGS